MGIAVAGWPDAAFDLLAHLEGEPAPAVLQSYREEHDRLVRRPMQELCDALGDVGGYGLAWPSARSGNPLTWQRTSATVWVARRVRMVVVFSLDGLLVEGGWTGKSTDQLWRYRAAVAADPSGAELAAIVADLGKAGLALTEDSLTKMPRGYSADHPRAELLLRRTVVAQHGLGAGPWLHSAEVVDRVRAAFDSLLPLTSWFVDHVATPTAGR